LTDQTIQGADLTGAFDFAEFQKVFQSKGRPGCVGLPEAWQAQVHCLKFNPQVKPTQVAVTRLEMFYATQGGEEIARSMQWFQGQYKKNRGGQIELKPEDIKMLTARLKKNPPDLFRRGLPIDRPSCQAALESFVSSSPDNFIRFKNPNFDKLVVQMRNPKLSTKALADLCAQGVQLLLASKRIIPLGPIHFPMLDSGRFTGWSINNLNQLDLSALKASSSR